MQADEGEIFCGQGKQNTAAGNPVCNSHTVDNLIAIYPIGKYGAP